MRTSRVLHVSLLRARVAHEYAVCDTPGCRAAGAVGTVMLQEQRQASWGPYITHAGH